MSCESAPKAVLARESIPSEDESTVGDAPPALVVRYHTSSIRWPRGSGSVYRTSNQVQRNLIRPPATATEKFKSCDHDQAEARRAPGSGLSARQSHRSLTSAINHPQRTWLLMALVALSTGLTSGQQYHHPHHRPPASPQQPPDQADFTRLEAPVGMHRFIQGPGVDLLALNRRRFESEHNHRDGETTESELRRGALIEANLAALPDRLLASLPEGVERDLIANIATDPTLILGDSNLNPESSLDPDNASIERLSKSCLSVHASSARPEQLNVTFHLYTKNNPLIPFILRPTITRLELIKSSPFDPNKPIKWITHGFHTNVDKSEWMLEAKDKILAFEDANVILTDWRRGASPALAFYPKAAANAHVVSKIIVKILRRLKRDIDFARVHLIGHSLGAHIMGFVGSAFTEEYLHQQQQLLTGRIENQQSRWNPNGPLDQASLTLIGRITACDPALPCFGPSSSGPNSKGSYPTSTVSTISTLTGSAPINSSYADATDWTPTMWTHLRPDSAIVVEVMHSNPGVMGYADPLGDFDFYPNGFERQPGCGNQPEGEGKAEKDTLEPHYGSHQYLVPAKTRVRRQSVNGLLGSMIKYIIPSQRGSRLSSTLDRFIKPIRDFVNGYTCSHHRSVEYMVESMYYDRIPQDRKLDKRFVCQMVGYRCLDYASFKRGFCFRCVGDHDCRAFLMPDIDTAMNNGHSLHGLAVSSPTHLTDSGGQGYRAVRSLQIGQLDKFQRPSLMHTGEQQEPMLQNSSQPGNWLNSHWNKAAELINDTLPIMKRVLPTFNHYNQNYQAPKRNHYYFDTRHTRDFCLHHYHLLVKYRWFRVRDNIASGGLTLSGTLANISQNTPITFYRFTHQSYTLLLTHPNFLGQVESLLMSGEKLKPSLIDYIEVTYMSNLDPRVRSLGSARLCRSPAQAPATRLAAEVIGDSTTEATSSQSSTLFVRCAGSMV